MRDNINTFIPSVTPPPRGASRYADYAGDNPVEIRPGSIINNNLPIVFGRAFQSPCYNIAAERDGRYLYLMYAISYGPISTFHGMTLGPGNSSQYLSSANFTFVQSVEAKLGNQNQTVNSVMSAITGFIDRHPGVVNFAVKVDTHEMDSSASLDGFASILGVKLEDTTGTYTAGDQYSPVYMALYMLLGNGPYAPEATISEIDTTSFEDAHDYCTSDPVKIYRYTAGCSMFPGDTLEDAKAALFACHMDIAVDTETGLLHVVNYNDAKTSSADLTEKNCFGSIEVNEIDSSKIPNELTVEYTDAYGERRSVTVSDGTGGDNSKTLYVKFINGASVATKWGETYLNLLSENIEVKAVFDDKMSSVRKGDVVTFDCPYGIGKKNFRVIEKVPLFDLGQFVCKLRIYKGAAQSDTDVSDDSVTQADLNTGTPDPPENVSWTPYTADTGRDSTGPAVKVTFDPPSEGPRVRNYEIEDNSNRILYRGAPGASEIHFNPVVVGSYKFKLYAVGYNGIRSTAVESATINVNRGEVDSIRTIGVSAMADTDGAVLTYDEDDDLYKPYIYPSLANYAEGTIAIGNESATVFPDMEGNIRAAVAMIKGDPPSADQAPLRITWENVAPSSITVKRKSGAATTAAINFTVVVISDNATLNLDGGGNQVPPETS